MEILYSHYLAVATLASIFAAADFAPSVQTSTQLNLPEGYLIDRACVDSGNDDSSSSSDNESSSSSDDGSDDGDDGDDGDVSGDVSGDDGESGEDCPDGAPAQVVNGSDTRHLVDYTAPSY